MSLALGISLHLSPRLNLLIPDLEHPLRPQICDFAEKWEMGFSLWGSCCFPGQKIRIAGVTSDRLISENAVDWVSV